MTRILVPTHVGDLHAMAVRRALARKGHEAVLWYGSDHPTRQRSSLSIGDGAELSWNVSGPELDLADAPFEVVWLRRLSPSILPADMHPGDREIANRECGSFQRSLWRLLAPEAFWINPLDSRERSTSKPIQLVESIRSGLSVPETLCSNDPDAIRRFIDRHQGRTIYKGFNPALWNMDTGIAINFTSAVTVADLPDDDMLQLSPGIFQRQVEKDHELRVTYMGDYAVTAKIHSQEQAQSKSDWRAAFDKLRLEPAELPPEVDRGCRELMRRLGIVFGCFDLIVTPEGRHVFVEVNEMGQFLWIEELNHDILMLEPFCDFLIHGRCDRDWQPSGTPLHFHDFRADAEQQRLAEEELRLHVVKPNFHTTDDRWEQKSFESRQSLAADAVAELEKGVPP